MAETPLQNKLSALSLAITDSTFAGDESLAPTAVAALMSIRDQEPLSIGDIARIVGLTHSAAVRLIDRLEKDWLVRRQRRVGREVMVEITARGRRKAQQLQELRFAAVDGYLTALNDEEQAQLNGLIDRLIAGRPETAPPPDQFCRLCKRGICDCGLHDPVPEAE